MIFKYLPTMIVAYLLAIIAAAFSALLMIMEYELYATAFLLIVISILLTINLYHKLNRVNRDVTGFLLSIKNDDLSQKFTRPANESFRELYDAFKLVQNKIHDERSESVDQYYLLQLVIEHVKVGLISFKEEGDVDLYNHSARQIFGIPYIKHIDDLSSFNTQLVKILKNAESNKRSLLKVESPNGNYQLAIEVTEFKQHQESFRLASIQDIRIELDQQEIESWQKLIRVLNHEVFNSITPIVSLSESAKEILSKANLETDMSNDINRAFSTIEHRGKNLLDFVDKFRSITHLPNPVYKNFKVKDIITGIIQLFNVDLKDHNIECEFMIDPDSIEITADQSMIEQILINIIRNAIQVLETRKKAKIEIRVNGLPTHVRIEIRDNGSGIAKESLDKVFIPFYSTKPQGSGIGLSLSKQVMSMHKGDISIESDEQGTSVILKFFY